MKKLVLLLVLVVLTMSSVLGAHVPSANLQPEWSAAGELMDYTVTFSNSPGSDPIDEIRIIKNPNYATFDCVDKSGDGWYLLEISPWYDGDLGLTEMCWYYTTDPNNDIPGGSSENYFFSATVPLSGCDHKWKFETRDEESSSQGDWESLFAYTSVDDLEPVIIKTLGEPLLENQDEIWIRQDTSINIEVYDEGICGVSGIDYCEYRYDVDGVEELPWTQIEWDSSEDINDVIHYYYSFYYKEDSEHFLEVRCYDNASNMAYHSQTEKVDSTPPVTEKTYGEPFYSLDGNYPHYIDTTTLITLDAEDGGLICAIGVKETWYRNFVVEDNEICVSKCDPEYYSQYAPDNGWTLYEGAFHKAEQSCHVIEYYSIDELGNQEETQWQCVFVEDQPPIVTVETGEPKVECGDGEDCDYWIQDHVTPITLSCYDQDPHPSGVKALEYRWYWDGVLQQDWTSYLEPIIFHEDSLHELEYKCVDNLGHESDIGKMVYFVDSQPPIINKTMVGKDYLGYRDGELNQDACPPKNPETDVCYVRDDGENGVAITVYDDPTYHAVGIDYCYYELWWATTEEMCKDNDGLRYDTDRQWCLMGDSEFTDSQDVIFTEDSTHVLYIYCVDKLTNYADDTEVFLVDSTPPVTTKTYGEPQKVDPICAEMCEYNEECMHSRCTWWITSNTPITLIAEDEKVGVNETKWRVLYFPDNDEICSKEVPNGLKVACDSACDPGYYSQFVAELPEWNVYDMPFNIPEDSCHVIEYYSDDKLGNEEIEKWQCVFVDNQAPKSYWEPGEPYIPVVQQGGPDFGWITQNTPIKIWCEDQLPHPVGQVTLFWRFSTCEGGFGQDCVNVIYSQWYNTTDDSVEVKFDSDCYRDLEFYCVDHLGNSEQIQNGRANQELFIVETVPPEIVKTIVGPHIVCPENDLMPMTDDLKCYMIDGVTEIIVDANDPDPHPVGQVQCEWGYWWLDEYYGPYMDATPFTISGWEESEHELHVKCWDALGNSVEDVEMFIVDKTAPDIWKEYGEPYLSMQYDDYWAEWINSETVITAGVVDVGTHLSGIKEVKYRTTVVDDEYCMYRTEDAMVCDDATGAGEWTEVEEYESFQFSVPDQSCHLIEIVATDNVDKTNTHKQCVFVDNTAPTPVKTVGEPKTKFDWDEQGEVFYPGVMDRCWSDDEDSIDCWKVTLMTPIDLSCEDPDPHPVENEYVCFQVGMDGDDLTAKYCVDYDGNMTDNGYCCVGKELEPFYFDETTYHNLAYYCVDGLGNSNEDDVDDEKFKVEETAFEIQLNKKWNLISTPVALLDNSMDIVFEGVKDTVETVWTYDAYTDQWHVFTPDGEDNDDIDTMLPGWGYWVFSNDNDNLTIGGSLLSPAMTPPSKPLKGDKWNLIGYYGAEGLTNYTGPVGAGKTAECALFSLSDDMLDIGWTGLYTYWEPYNPNTFVELNMLDRMDPGAGYWVKPTVDSDYSPTTNCYGLWV